MLSQKNRLMFKLSFSVILLSIIVHLLHRVFHVFQHHSMMGPMAYDPTISDRFALEINILLIIPIILYIYAYMLYRKDPTHVHIPMLHTFVLTFSSISIIAGGGGAVEFHFSIFMVLAIVSYYENIKLLLTMTTIFTIQHLLGFFVIPELVFGVSTYSFIMLLIHAVFLVATSAAQTIQIQSKKKLTDVLEKEKAEKQAELIKLLDSVKTMAQDLDSTSTVVTNKSGDQITASEDMLASYQQVSTGLQSQNQSVTAVNTNLQQINNMIQRTSTLSQNMTEDAGTTDRLVSNNKEHIQSLFDQIILSSKTIQEAAKAMEVLNKSTRQVESIIATIQDIANRTNLLALNASIEAAHAKEYGRGFSVVASEIRQLAEQSSEATEEIQQILTAIRNESVQTVTQMEAGQQAASLSVKQAEQSITSYQHMTQSIHSLITHLHDLNESLTQIELRSNDISSEMTSISRITNGSVQSMDQLQNLSQSQMTITHEVNEELHRLKEQSRSLQAQF